MFLIKMFLIKKTCSAYALQTGDEAEKDSFYENLVKETELVDQRNF